MQGRRKIPRSNSDEDSPGSSTEGIRGFAGRIGNEAEEKYRRTAPIGGEGRGEDRAPFVLRTPTQEGSKSPEKNLRPTDPLKNGSRPRRRRRPGPRPRLGIVKDGDPSWQAEDPKCFHGVGEGPRCPSLAPRHPSRLMWEESPRERPPPIPPPSRRHGSTSPPRRRPNAQGRGTSHAAGVPGLRRRARRDPGQAGLLPMPHDLRDLLRRRTGLGRDPSPSENVGVDVRRRSRAVPPGGWPRPPGPSARRPGASRAGRGPGLRRPAPPGCRASA